MFDTANSYSRARARSSHGGPRGRGGGRASRTRCSSPRWPRPPPATGRRQWLGSRPSDPRVEDSSDVYARPTSMYCPARGRRKPHRPRKGFARSTTSSPPTRSGTSAPRSSPAGGLMKSLAVADRHGGVRFAAHQVCGSLAVWDFENELGPPAVDHEVGSVIWSGLGEGRFDRQGQARPPAAAARAPPSRQSCWVHETEAQLRENPGAWDGRSIPLNRTTRKLRAGTAGALPLQPSALLSGVPMMSVARAVPWFVH